MKASIVVVIICLIVQQTNCEKKCHQKCICNPKVLTCKGFNQDDIEGDEFANSITTDLERIHITDGDIPELPRNLLGSCADDSSYHLNALKKLDLQNNGIKKINGQTLHCVPNLEELNLANNQWNVSTVHTRTFTNIQNLKKLNLSDALHDEIDSKEHIKHLRLVFLESPFTKLEVLALDNNKFSVYDADTANTMCTFTSLKRLNLAHNIIPSLTFYHKRCLTHLEHLDLSYNSINTFEAYSNHNGLLFSLDQIQKVSNLSVNFYGNEFDCDCHMQDFHDWLKRTEVHVFKKNILICHDSLHFNRSIVSVPSAEFVCLSGDSSSNRSPSNAAVGVLVTMFVLLAIFLSVIAYIKRDTIKHFVTSFKRPSMAKSHLLGNYSSVNNENATDMEV
ncbi:trophoblast glycoprotein-like [Mytilus edulis]|uniref:trophoblast glycoprotein-like n=1 Tax=Mytilus edulis TaxID=6550 RepID=UPI0039F070BF